MAYQQYVCGFMVTGLSLQNEGLFIRKNRPAFQAGKCNGIGGKIEWNESPIDAMVREFYEEAGVQTNPGDWQHTISLRGHDFVVYYYRNLQPMGLPPFESKTDEPVEQWNLIHFLQMAPKLDNLLWILPMTLSARLDFPITVNHAIGDEAKL